MMLPRFYRSLLRWLPTPVALSLMRVFIGKSQRPAVTPSQQTALDAATRTSYGPDGSRVAWSWGSGPLVLFVHGWNGRAAQLAPLAQRVAAEGYRCVCIDVTAHGESAGRRPSWRHFLADVAVAAKHFGAIHTFVGHSAGGLAMIAAQAQRRLHAHAYACICAPSHPFPPIRTLQQLLDPPQRIVDACRADIAAQFGTTWARLENGDIWTPATPLLLFYDRKDRFIDHEEADRIAQWVPDARVHKSEGQGHARVLASDELARTLVEFVNERAIRVRSAAVG